MEPLPPVKEVEYRCYIGKHFDELSGQEHTTFAFETAKEFSNFRYEIAVRYRIQPGQLEFKVLGMTATRTMMPAFGTAKSVLKLANLPLGIYNLIMIKSDGTENIFSFEFTKRGFQILGPVPRKRFIDLVVESKSALAGAKIISTVTKTPPIPLIPRTIQKRQPPPPTPEELAILASLKSETPEERDAREERELFGESKRAAKKELEEAEKELKKTAQDSHSKSHAKATNGVPHKAEKTSKSAHQDTKASKAHTTAKPAAKSMHNSKAPTKHTAKSASTKTGHSTVTKNAHGKSAKPASRSASHSAANHSAPKKTVKSPPAKTGSSKTAKHPAKKSGNRK